jgi:phage terminase large subunit-like protein
MSKASEMDAKLLAIIKNLPKLSEKERLEAQAILTELERRANQRRFFKMFPDDGEFPRHKYTKHLEFIADGKQYRERCFLAANRCGKTVVGAYEAVAHATGRYPPWWDGYKFDHPISAWAAGDTAKTTRDIIQVELLGQLGMSGTGMIPGDDIVRTTSKAGVPDAVDTIYVKHYNDVGEQDGISEIGLKSYDQGRIAFQGTAKDLIRLDEECPMEVYMECLVRTMTTKGLIYTTFTPLKGMTEVVMLFMPTGKAEQDDR